jgi:hypothetical protein
VFQTEGALRTSGRDAVEAAVRETGQGNRVKISVTKG